MAGMFYSLKEAAEKLNMTAEELKELAKEGKLREFRDGSTVLPEPTIEPEKAAEPEQAAAPELELEPERAELQQQPRGLDEATMPEPPTEPDQTSEEEILLAPETGTPAETDLTSADTALTGEGITVLGETDRDYEVTDDTMAETTGTMGTTGTTPEASLEEIEEDVNLDSFGSGSGLLDLSLQADDTSLGGILDEIYTTEGGEEGPETAEPGSALEVAPEAEQMLAEAEEDLVGAQMATQLPIMAQAYAEPQPDVQSNTLGMLLFLPLLVLLYTAIVAVAGLKGVMPSILAPLHGAIWYIVIGAVLVTVLVVGAAFMLSGESKTGIKKEKKPKKPRKSKKKSSATPEEAAI